ncbi:hypothetical protein C1X05_13060 [Laceyella sacchari]|nr:hypothetical protein C1X05_13060 [Laceyella sacchari]
MSSLSEQFILQSKSLHEIMYIICHFIFYLLFFNRTYNKIIYKLIGNYLQLVWGIKEKNEKKQPEEKNDFL